LRGAPDEQATVCPMKLRMAIAGKAVDDICGQTLVAGYPSDETDEGSLPRSIRACLHVRSRSAAVNGGLVTPAPSEPSGLDRVEVGVSSSENVQAVRRLFDRMGNAAGWKAMVRQIADAIPDSQTEIDDILGDGDTVAVRYTSRGTHTGELFGVAPTNRTMTTSGMEMYRLSGGRVVECWGQYDMSELFTPKP
jgi:predicted ester cyclase